MMALGDFDFAYSPVEAVFVDWPCADFGPENAHSALI